MILEKLEAFYKRIDMIPCLAEACSKCRMCDLGWQNATRGDESYNPHVFCNYHPLNPIQKFMIVGQNPGWNEVVAGQPFVGDAGSNFEKALSQTMWERQHFYITNAVKCWTNRNCPPTIKQIEKCEPFLRMELAIVKPILVVAFGAVAFGMLCPGLKFSDYIGKIAKSDKFGIKVFTTYHPSPRNIIVKARADQFNKDVVKLGLLMDRILLPW